MTTLKGRIRREDDFGYDFSVEEEELLFQLTCNKSTDLPSRDKSGTTTTLIDAVPTKVDSVYGDDSLEEDEHGLLQRRRSDYVPSLSGRGKMPEVSVEVEPSSLPSQALLPKDVPYPDLASALVRVDSDAAAANNTKPKPKPTSPPVQYKEDRTPLQRFRSFPRKPLTVTDLTAGAWCELQYWYTLTRLPGGRRTKTAAMRQGSKVHQKLEDEVHTTVHIDIMTKEDGFGLRLWNLVQGLRTLRDTGLTRELEVWGTVDGNLVNGVIDSVSYENPNPGWEEELSSQESEPTKHQSRLTDFYPSKSTTSDIDKKPKIYLTDVKTRGTTAPVTPSLLRPAKVQLLLYHRMLSDMAAGKLELLKIFRRYGLDPDDTFSDSFLAQIAGLHDEIFSDAQSSSDGPTPESSDPSQLPRSSTATSNEPDLIKYSTLRELIPLVQDEIKLAFPLGEQSMGQILRVQYRHREDGRLLDTHDVPVSAVALDDFLKKYMLWWNGKRDAEGVTIEEAFKCRTCEFVEGCSWRQEMDEERVQKVQQRMRTKRRADAST